MMMKKALRNTMIFSLIIANLIIWPMLFSDLGEDSRKEASVEQENSSGKEMETEATATENGEKAFTSEEQLEESSSEKAAQRILYLKFLKLNETFSEVTTSIKWTLAIVFSNGLVLT
ncbi:hypothetical protein [Cytobacillus praedii]|uniref:hypothetical protein n=1 Tax=Cytobacillus praedii TaxID=1742358 RepID=UPI003AF9AE81